MSFNLPKSFFKLFFFFFEAVTQFDVNKNGNNEDDNRVIKEIKAKDSAQLKGEKTIAKEDEMDKFYF